MSGQQQQQQPQRMRRNVSPGTTKQGPLRATVPLSLMHQTCSPTRCLNQKESPSNSPAFLQSEVPKIKTRNSPDSRISPETQSPTFSGIRVEKGKTASKPVSSASYIRRTASVDTIYLLGQWQRDALYLSYCGRLMMDRATQTPDEDDLDRKHQKKSSTASTDTLEMKFIRQRLQRTNQHSRATGPPTSYQRHSPVHGDHSAISLSSVSGGNTSPVVPSNSTVSLHHQLLQTSAASTVYTASNSGATCSSSTSGAAATTSICSRALAIPIPDIPKPLIPRMRSSVEGLNQEIERLVLKEISSIDGNEAERTLDPTPEGHRAPIADLFRKTQNVDTQTPFSRRDSCHSSSNSPQSRSSSISPIIAGQQMDTSRPTSGDDNGMNGSPETDSLNKLASSPHLNKFLTREPPDGCEKVKISEEIRSSVSSSDPQIYNCPKPRVSFVLLPSQSSAFYPLCKNCVMATSEESAVDCSPATSLASATKRMQ